MATPVMDFQNRVDTKLVSGEHHRVDVAESASAQFQIWIF